MKVYVVVEYYPYEGGDVIGVYASREAAEAYASEIRKDNEYQYFAVQEWEVVP